MIRTQIYLTEKEHSGISSLASNLKKKQSELIRQAIDEFLIRSNPADKLKKIRAAKGIWKDRDDFDLENVRAEFDRF
jgi:tRNA A37 threonylcarbamoyladenosine modification protein TsaB